jgi:hypothetical protein
MQNMEERVAEKLIEKIAAISDVTRMGSHVFNGGNDKMAKSLFKKTLQPGQKKMHRTDDIRGAANLVGKRGYKLGGPSALQGGSDDSIRASMKNRMERLGGLEMLRGLQGR